MLLSLFGPLDNLISPAPEAARVAFLRARPFAHRGLHGPGVLENSRAAFTAAVDGGFGIELDVQASREGEAFVFHDSELDRLADASTPAQPASPASPASPLAGGLNDCPLCLLAQDRLAGLPPGPVQLLVAGLAPELPRAGPAVVRRAAVALAPPARGPPTFS
jgi:hypothetical protein